MAKSLLLSCIETLSSTLINKLKSTNLILPSLTPYSLLKFRLSFLPHHSLLLTPYSLLKIKLPSLTPYSLLLTPYSLLKLFLLGLFLAIAISACNPPVSTPPPQLIGEFRTVKHAMGESRVPLSPQRVVVLDTAILDSAIALGVKPIAGTFYEGIPAYLQDKSEGIENVGLESQPNLEKMLLLKPDLILGDRLSGDALYDSLSRIAPTVYAEGSGWKGEWKDNFRIYAAALGKEEAGKQLLQQYDRRLAQFKQQMGDRLNSTVSIMVSKPEEVVIYTSSSFPGSVVQDAGLRRPAVQQRSDPLLNVSLETIPDLEADAVFLIKNNQLQDDPTLKRFMAHPLWSKLKPVHQGRVYPVDSETWIGGRSLLAANAAIDDLFKYLVRGRGSKE